MAVAPMKGRKRSNQVGKIATYLQSFLALILVLYLLGLWMTNANVWVEQQERTPVKALSSSSFAVQSTLPDFPREPRPRPPLDTIVQGWNITGDPSWLLNLAIIGFPKTGTSTLMKYLHKSPQIHIFDEERCEMGYNQQARLMQSLYNDIPSGDFIRGIKCPRDLETGLALANYQKYFPTADFMVGLRHPIEWFESFYNFRVNNMFTMPPADKLLGRCTKRHQGLCTFRGNFHLFLANLGKTNILTNSQEQALIPEEYRKMIQPIPSKGRIFLWDISQLKRDDDITYTSQQNKFSNARFRQDLQHFLRLEQPLPEMIWVKPGYSHSKNQTLQEHVRSQKIDICREQYQTLREILLRQGALAGRWIRDFFLHSEDVFVSQKEHFVNVILKSWEVDPCFDRAKELVHS